MIQKQVVLRNKASRDDAVYIVTVTLELPSQYTVIGSQGRWNDFTKTGKPESKIYYAGTSQAEAQASAELLIKINQKHNYYPEPQPMAQTPYNTEFLWEPPVRLVAVSWKPEPETQPLPAVVQPQVELALEKPCGFTRAALLELD